MRIIARLDIKNEYVIKGIQMEGLRKVGDPTELATKYYKSCVDELLFMDAVATLYGRNNLFKLIKDLCKQIFIPVTIGGGIRSVSDAEFALANGADRVAINTAAVNNINLITEIASNFGAQAVVGSVEAKRVQDKIIVYTHNGREPTNMDVVSWSRSLYDAGCGEVLVTSIDKDGSRKGFDNELTKSIVSSVNCPVVVSGGFGNIDHLDAVLSDCPLSGIAIGAAFHYQNVTIDQVRKATVMLRDK